MTIRKQPADFRVEELLTAAFTDALTAEADAAHPYAVYRLNKESLTTPEAVGRLAKALGFRPGSVEYAGLKDKHALTTQHVTVHCAQAADAERLAAEARGQGFEASRVGFAGEAINADAIERNRFTIVVRDLSRQASDEMERRADLLAVDALDEDGNLVEEEGPCLRIVNYFGDQRFGSARHKQGFVAKHLIKGDFDGALRLAIGTPARKDSGKTRDFTRMAALKWGDWRYLAANLPRCPERAPIERLAAGDSAKDAFTHLPYFLQQMYVEAYQSFLWNNTARSLVLTMGQVGVRSVKGQPGKRVPSQLLHASDTYGELVFAPAALIPDEFGSLELPLLASKSTLDEPWGSAAKGALEEEGLTVDQLQIPGLRRPYFGESKRALFVIAQRVALEAPELDEMSGSARRGKRIVSFELPRGSYATVVLRSLGQ